MLLIWRKARFRFDDFPLPEVLAGLIHISRLRIIKLIRFFINLIIKKHSITSKFRLMLL